MTSSSLRSSSGAGATDQADHLAPEHVKVEMVVHDMVAELGAHAAQLQHDVPTVAMIDQLPPFQRRGGGFVLRTHTLASRKMIENTASRTMTQKIDSTTERVVS